jgi:hypothetical protein
MSGEELDTILSVTLLLVITGLLLESAVRWLWRNNPR